MSTLGPIWWDFANLRMEFTLGGLRHVLRGVTKDGCKVIKGGSLNKLLLQEPQIALLLIREVAEIQSEMEPALLFSHFTASGT